MHFRHVAIGRKIEITFFVSIIFTRKYNILARNNDIMICLNRGDF